MEHKNVTVTSLPSIPSLRHRKSLPDVPQDVEIALLHLNDPNYDLDSIDTCSFSDESFELEDKKRYTGALSIGHSIGTGPSEYDTESRVDSRADSRMKIRSTETLEYDE